MDEIKRLILGEDNGSADPAPIFDCPEVFIGQEKIVEKTDILIERVKSSKKALPHMLFVGEEGMGKGTLGRVIAKRINSRITILNAQTLSLSRAGDFIGILTNLEERDILCISEIDKLSKTFSEFLFPAISNFKIDFVVDKGPHAQTINFDLKRFTLIATTSQLNRVNKNLLTCFFITYAFEPYLESQIGQILVNKAKVDGLQVEEKLLEDITKKAYGIPAEAMGLFNKAVIYAKTFDIKILTKEIFEESIKLSGYQATLTARKLIDRSISDDVRLKVWRRDEGKCVKCGSLEKLEYDHIIPVSKGGSNTERNVRLLCEKCNRTKSDGIV